MPRRPWRSLNSFSASPIRVPLDQSGAATAARWIARSGRREAARGSGGSAAWRTRTPRRGAAPGGPGEELQVGARVGLHRARDVAQQHEPPGDDAPARRASRTGSPPVRRLARSVGAGRPARRGGPARGGGCAAAAWRARGAPSAGRAARAPRLERVEALAGQPLLVAGERQRNVGLRHRRFAGAREARRDGARPRPLPRARAVRGALASRAAPAARRRASRSAGPRRRRRPSEKTASKAWTWDWSDTNTERASSTAAGGCSAAPA